MLSLGISYFSLIQVQSRVLEQFVFFQLVHAACQEELAQSQLLTVFSR